MLKSKPDVIITAMTHVNVVSLIVKKYYFFKLKLIISKKRFRYDKFTKINIKDKFKILAKMLYQYADHVIAISDGVKKFNGSTNLTRIKLLQFIIQFIIKNI